MANNRMWLIHRESKLGVMIGKRMGWGWYNPPKQEQLMKFFEYLEKNPCESQDDFVLAMEDCSNSNCFDGWRYTNDLIEGFRVFEIDEEVKGKTDLDLLISMVRRYREYCAEAEEASASSELRLIMAGKASGIHEMLEEVGILVGKCPVLKISHLRECGETIRECAQRLKPLALVVGVVGWDWTGSGFTGEEIDSVIMEDLG